MDAAATSAGARCQRAPNASAVANRAYRWVANRAYRWVVKHAYRWEELEGCLSYLVLSVFDELYQQFNIFISFKDECQFVVLLPFEKRLDKRAEGEEQLTAQKVKRLPSLQEENGGRGELPPDNPICQLLKQGALLCFGDVFKDARHFRGCVVHYFARMCGGYERNPP